ncbi:GtrA family protein [Yersinia intermedia]|uniref:GtrA family protein n=1 Tax=Yersinia intermedia TaxID=631 RepID=UPI002244775A|nr:GtrA family protein [Yersinia intermedia]MCW8112792.1 GtrA family protein [Yersinia intermedia]MDA5516526.1 GtrA family protein [Yersinia intermedia]
MLKLFSRYISVGVVNTAIHWMVFAIIFYGVRDDQVLSNFTAFCVAVTFSFFANARFTFKAQTTTIRYMLYIGFMGALSSATGWASESRGLPPIFTLVVFSAISLVCGFFYSKYIVFRSEQN